MARNAESLVKNYGIGSVGVIPQDVAEIAQASGCEVGCEGYVSSLPKYFYIGDMRNI